MMDVTIIGAVIIIVCVVIGAAVYYSFTKKGTDYKTNGIPKQVEKKEEIEGSTDKTE